MLNYLLWEEYDSYMNEIVYTVVKTTDINDNECERNNDAPKKMGIVTKEIYDAADNNNKELFIKLCKEKGFEINCVNDLFTEEH